MATGGQKEPDWKLIKVGELTLEKTHEDPSYISIVVCQDKIVVLDWMTDNHKVNIHGLHDGKLLASSGRMESVPRDMCLMDAMTICVIHRDGLIKMMSIDSTDMSRVIKTTRTLGLQGVLLDEYDSVVRFKDSLVVTGVKQGMIYWCIVSLQDGHVETIHQICKGDGRCRVTTKDTIIYISCYAGDESPDNTGVYGFDILNPSQCKYKYKHQLLQCPTSIVINEDGNIFVCDYGLHDDCIHQLTASCQLVAIFTQEIPWNLYALFWDNGCLYGTCKLSRDITVFRAVYQGTQKDSEVETSIEIEQGNIDKGKSSIKMEMPPSEPSPEDLESRPSPEDSQSRLSPEDSQSKPSNEDPESRPNLVDSETRPNPADSESSVKTEMPPCGPSTEDSKDEKQDHNASEVLMRDERKSVIEETSTKIVQEIADKGTELPPSGPARDGSEDEKQGDHKATDIPINDERKQPVIDGTSTQIGQEIVDEGQSRVATEMPPSGHVPEESEDDKQVGSHKASQEQGNPIQRSLVGKLNQAEIQMSTEDQNLFLKFQQEIGTTLFFSHGEQTLTDDNESLKTEKFLQENRPDMMDKWLEYTKQGKLTHELIDAICANERNLELHNKKGDILGQMEKLNIIVKARSFNQNGVKEDNFFYTPCMLRLESPREVISPEQDPRMLSTSVLCWVFSGTFLPPSIFDGLLAACLARWPVTKKKDTSENLISFGCTVFDLDLTHRLILNCENHIVYARITWLVIDDIKTPDAKLCTRVRMFISQKLSKITNSLSQDLQYKLCLQSHESQDVTEDSRIPFSPFQMWFEDEVHDPDSPIKPEHMNHARLCVALVTVCGKALREMLLENFPVPYIDIYQAILANQAKLMGGKGRPLLNQEQIKLVFPNPPGQKTGTVEMFDLSLLYTLIRNVSTVQAPIKGWGIDPQPGDNSLGASVERIRSYRNHISGHSPDAKINQQDFNDYWKKFEDVLHDIEVVINRQVYSTELERQKRQVISVFDAC